MSFSEPVLFAFDGSQHARAAIAQAGGLLRPGPAVVVTAWPMLETAAAAALIALPPAIVSEAVTEIDTATREDAEAIALEGVKLAAAAGFEARPHVIRSAGACSPRSSPAPTSSTPPRSSSAHATQHAGATLLGSDSTGVLHHTARPVMVGGTASRGGRRRHS